MSTVRKLPNYTTYSGKQLILSLLSLILLFFCFARLALLRIRFSALFYLAWLQLSTPLNSRSFCNALHSTYSSCRTRHCRWCTSIVHTPMPCRPEPHCCANPELLLQRPCRGLKPSMSLITFATVTEAGIAPTTTTDELILILIAVFILEDRREKPISNF